MLQHFLIPDLNCYHEEKQPFLEYNEAEMIDGTLGTVKKGTEDTKEETNPLKRNYNALQEIQHLGVASQLLPHAKLPVLYTYHTTLTSICYQFYHLGIGRHIQ